MTDIRQRLRSQRKQGHKTSFFGFILSAIAKTIEDNKELNHILCGRKIYYFDDVDIDTAIELKFNGISIPRKYVVRDAARKTMEEITLEIEKAKINWKESGIAGEDDKWALRWIKLASILPKWYLKFIFRRFSKMPFKIKQRFGTTYVTSVSGFTDISGFAIPYIEGGNRPLSFPIGSIVKKPGVINSEIKIREYMSLTICINHDLVDGAPAARFVPGSPQEHARADLLKKELESHLGTDNVAVEEFTFSPGAFLSSYPICGLLMLLAALLNISMGGYHPGLPALLR